jgi:hypothetical protein
MKSISHILSPSSLSFTLPSYKYSLPPTLPILQSCLSFLISKSMFTGVSWYIPAAVLYFGQFNSFHYSPLTLPSHLPHFITAFNSYPSILYLHRCYVLQYCWRSIIPFSFPFFPEFHSVVPLLQTCSTCLFLCIYLSFGSIFHLWEKTYGLYFSEPDLTSLNMISTNCIHLTSNHMAFFHMAE